jgi:hypothetical protein
MPRKSYIADLTALGSTPPPGCVAHSLRQGCDDNEFCFDVIHPTSQTLVKITGLILPGISYNLPANLSCTFFNPRREKKQT